MSKKIELLICMVAGLIWVLTFPSYYLISTHLTKGNINLSLIATLGVVTLGLTIFMFEITKRTHELTTFVWLGFLMQLILTQALYFFLTLKEDEPDQLLLFGAFILVIAVLFLLIPQVLLSSVYLLFRRKITIHPWQFIALLTLFTGGFVFFIGKAFGPLNSPEYHENIVLQKYTDLTSSFREEEKNKTLLGGLPRPLGIMRGNRGYFGVDADGNKRELLFLDSLQVDAERGVYFDIYKDAVYYIKDNVAYALEIQPQASSDIKTSVRKLHPAIQEYIQQPICVDGFIAEEKECIPKKIVGAHGNILAIYDGFRGASDGIITTFNMENGEMIARSMYVGYDYLRLHLFWLGDTRYRLMTRSDERNMEFYLDVDAEPFVFPTSTSYFMDTWGEVAYCAGCDFYFNNKKPIYSYNAPVVEKRMPRWVKVSVRNLYRLQDNNVALEIDDKLLFVDLINRTGRLIENQNEIRKIMEGAILLLADDEQQSYFDCVDRENLFKYSEKVDEDFVFCLM